MKPSFFPIVILISSLSGCVHQTLTPAITDTAIYQKQLSTLTHWELEGKIGIRHANKSDSAAMQWKQDNNHFDIFLNGPLGTGATRLIGTPKQLTIENGQEAITTYTDPELMIERRLGWTLPLDKLPQWILGCSNNKTARFHIDHTLESFSENDWHVKYVTYQQVGSYVLPEKIIITHEDMQVTIAIKQWSLQ